jgi:amino acid transporter
MASLRNLPLVAEFGYSALFFFLIVAIGFLIPSALVSAELATGWPKSGGIYVWVREAFGDSAGFFAIWMQWVHNVFWFPAILSFVSTTFCYAFIPSLASNKYFTLGFVLLLYWAMTLFNFKGLRISAKLSTIGVIAGTIFPGLFIIFLGLSWALSGNLSQIHFSLDSLIPNMKSFDNIAFLAGLFLAFAGLEVSAGYASEVRSPQKNYPRGIVFAALITFFLFMLGSLAIAIVIPKNQISLVGSVMDAFKIFLENYHMSWLTPIMGVLLMFGALAETNSWIIGPIKGLYATAAHGNLPPILQKQNKNNIPVNLLILQAIIVTIASICFLFMQSISTAYWLLSALSTQIYLAMYIMMFISAIRLRYTKPLVKRTYKIPHPHKGMWAIAILGIISSLFAFVVFYIPPKSFKIDNLFFFESYLIIGFLAMSLVPIAFHYFKKPHWKN